MSQPPLDEEIELGDAGLAVRIEFQEEIAMQAELEARNLSPKHTNLARCHDSECQADADDRMVCSSPTNCTADLDLGSEKRLENAVMPPT